jgi:hypothetical protein
METVRSRFDPSVFIKNRSTTSMPSQLKKVEENITTIDFDSSPFDLIRKKRKRDEEVDVLKTQTKKDGLLYEAKKKPTQTDDLSQQISQAISKRYIETTQSTTNYHKDVTSLNQIRPKIKALIDLDESSTDLANHLHSEGFYFRSSTEYMWDPQLFMLSSCEIPEEARRIIDQWLAEKEDFLHSILPEIETAFVAANGKFIYWPLTQTNKVNRPKEGTLEFEGEIVSVGLAKPPRGFFVKNKTEFVLLIGVDHELHIFNIEFDGRYSSQRGVTFEKIEHKIPWQDIEWSKIVTTESGRSFVGWKGLRLKEVQFEITKTWITQKVKKFIEAKDANEPNFIFKLLPNIFGQSKSEIEKMHIDEKKNLVYALAFKQYDENAEIRPCCIEIYHLGPFAKHFKKVTTITQSELEKQYVKRLSLKEELSLQIIGIHPISLDESHEVDFLLVTSNGYRIYIRLETIQYLTDKLMEMKDVDYTWYFDWKPTGNWEIISIVTPPLPKDITTSAKGSRLCSNIDLTHQDTFVMNSLFSNGLTFMTGVDYVTEKETIVYIDDSEWYVKSKMDAVSPANITSKFWAIRIGDNKNILDIQKRAPEWYVDSDLLKTLGYQNCKYSAQQQAEGKVRHNNYNRMKKNIYSQQVYLKGDQYYIMMNYQVLTVSKVSILLQLCIETTNWCTFYTVMDQPSYECKYRQWA